MELDSSGNPHISYYEDGDVKYTYKNGSQWHKINVDTDVYADTTSIALDSSDRPQITYTSIETGSKTLKYAYDDGSKHIDTVLSGIGYY